ncbi:Cytoplasmic polyadenylation element-binding protein 1 [Aphelenchoides avenae]|nr:Cytoplasmic polyadenylation element-binding protein 1 [Aphelenchus avenae]
MCDNCGGKFCGQRYAQYFCGDPSCLSYYCEACWDLCHYGQSMVKNRSTHRPFVRMGEQTKLLSRPTHHASGQGPIMSPPPSFNLTGSAPRTNYGEAAASMSSLASASNFNLSFFAPRPPTH